MMPQVCDFGLARQFAKDQDDGSDYVAPIYTNNVVTLWYRGPELLLGSKVPPWPSTVIISWPHPFPRVIMATWWPRADMCAVLLCRL